MGSAFYGAFLRLSCFFAFIALVWFSGHDSCSVQRPSRKFDPYTLDNVSVKIGEHQLKFWIMDTPAKRCEGMKGLEESQVPQENGMLFVFPRPSIVSFWMQHTYIPLDIAFIDSQGVVLETASLQALCTDIVRSKETVQYVIEMKQGAFARYGIVPGLKIPTLVQLKALE